MRKGGVSSNSPRRPKWWQVYLSFPLLVALFTLEGRLKLSSGVHLAAQIGILLLVYGLIHLWLKANSVPLSQMDQTPSPTRVTVIPAAPYRLSGEERPIFQLPDSEIKGVLGDTFEMDYIDVDSFPADPVPQELHKESE